MKSPIEVAIQKVKFYLAICLYIGTSNRCKAIAVFSERFLILKHSL